MSAERIHPYALLTMVLIATGLLWAGRLGPIPVRAQAPPSWPADVPRPSFGLDEQPGAISVTVFPGASMPSPIPAGAVIQLGPGTHNVAGKTWTSAGTITQPVFIVAAPGAVVTGTSGFKINGTYLVIEGVTFTNWRGVIGGQNIALRFNDASGHTSTSAGSVISFTSAARDVVFVSNKFHDNGGPPPGSTAEADFHGIKISTSTPARRIWIVDHTSYGNGGDSVQCGSATGSEPWPGEIYIVRGRLFEEGENALDFKRCEDIIVVGTEIYGMRASSSSGGVGIVLHNGGREVTIRDVKVHHNEGEGFTSTGHGDFVVETSTFEDNRTGARAYSSSGIIRNNVFRRNTVALNVTGNVTVVGNFVEGGPSPTPTPSPTATPTPTPTPTPSPTATPTPTPTPSPSAPPAPVWSCFLTLAPDGRLVLVGDACTPLVPIR